MDGRVGCTLLTTALAGVFAQVHDRMPVMLPQNRWEAWLDPATPWPQARSLLAPSDLYGALHAYRVDQSVGDVRNDSPELILPLATSA